MIEIAYILYGAGLWLTIHNDDASMIAYQSVGVLCLLYALEMRVQLHIFKTIDYDQHEVILERLVTSFIAGIYLLLITFAFL